LLKKPVTPGGGVQQFLFLKDQSIPLTSHETQKPPRFSPFYIDILNAYVKNKRAKIENKTQKMDLTKALNLFKISIDVVDQNYIF
jgi:hypothetical protein